MYLLGGNSYGFQDATGLARYTVKRDPSLLRVSSGVRFSWFGFAPEADLSP